MPDPTGRVSHLPDMHRGVAWKEPVRVATSSNIAITGQGAGAAIDGVTLAAGDRILLKNQTAASSNGIYQVRAAGLAALRTFDMDQDASSSVPASEVVGAVVQVVAGGSNSGTFWRTTNTTAPAIGTDAINWLHMPMQAGASAGATTITGALEVVIDGGGSAITTGVKGDVEMPFAGTFTAWRIFADASGAIVVDVWKDTYANFPPTDADAMPGAGKEPTIPASGAKAEDTSITDWIAYTFSAGDVLRFNVDSATTITRATLVLHYTRTL